MGNQSESAMQQRIREMSIFIEKIEQKIEEERSQKQPNLDLIKRLEDERRNLDDTLKQALEI